MKKAEVWVSITPYKLKMIAGMNKKSGLQILAHSVMALSGKHAGLDDMKDATYFADEIYSFIKVNKLKPSCISFVSESENTLIRNVEMPSKKLKDIELILKNQLNQYIPVNPSEYVIQFSTFKNHKKVENPNILIGALKKDVVDQHYDIVENLKYELGTLDISANALKSLSEMIYQPESSIQYNMILDMGMSSVALFIFQNYQLVLARNIKGNNMELLKLIAESNESTLDKAWNYQTQLTDFNITSKKKNIGKSEETSEVPTSKMQSLKKRLEKMGLESSMPSNDDNSIFEEAEATEDITKRNVIGRIDGILNEIEKVVHYSFRHYGFSQLSSISVCGDMLNMPGLNTFIQSKLHSDVKSLNLDLLINWKKSSCTQEDISKYHDMHYLIGGLLGSRG